MSLDPSSCILSERVASITLKAGKYYIRDLCSRTGVLLNLSSIKFSRIQQQVPYELNVDTIICFGSCNVTEVGDSSTFYDQRTNEFIYRVQAHEPVLPAIKNRSKKRQFPSISHGTTVSQKQTEAAGDNTNKQTESISLYRLDMEKLVAQKQLLDELLARWDQAEIVICHICMEILTEPVVTPDCHKSVCKHCFTTWQAAKNPKTRKGGKTKTIPCPGCNNSNIDPKMVTHSHEKLAQVEEYRHYTKKQALISESLRKMKEIKNEHHRENGSTQKYVVSGTEDRSHHTMDLYAFSESLIAIPNDLMFSVTQKLVNGVPQLVFQTVPDQLISIGVQCGDILATVKENTQFTILRAKMTMPDMKSTGIIDLTDD